MRVPLILGSRVFLCCALLASACTPSSFDDRSQAITGGAADTQDSSAVFMISTAGGISGYCSGMVVSPHVVLTAAHCTTAGGTPASAKFSIFLGADYHDAAAMAAPENHVEVTTVLGHPDFNRQVPVTADVGVLITSAPIPRPAVPLNHTVLGSGDVGRSVRIIGYGQTEGSDGGYPPLETIGRRSSADTKIATVDREAFTVKGASNTCLVDSGGPTVMDQDGVEVVVGVHSLIDSYACNGTGTDTRVDRYVEFIDEQIQAAEASVPDMATSDASAAPATPSGCAYAGGTRPTAMGVLLVLALLLRHRRLIGVKGI